MSVSYFERYNGYWVSSADRKVRNFLWDNEMIAEDHRHVFVAQTLGVGRGTCKVRLTFEGLCRDTEGEGVWIYDRERWFWRITFQVDGRDHVFITFKEPRGPLPFHTYRTSVFGAVYDEKSLVGYVHWRITLKEVSRLYKTINPFSSKLLNRAYRMLLVYPTIVGAGTANALVMAPYELLKAIVNYSWTFYAGEIDSDVAKADYRTPYPHEIALSSDEHIPLHGDWKDAV